VTAPPAESQGTGARTTVPSSDAPKAPLPTEGAAKVAATGGAAKAAPAARASAAKPATGAAKPEPKTPAPPPGPPDPPPPADIVPPDWVQALHHALPNVATVSYWVGDWTVIVPPDRLVEVLTWMRDAPPARFSFCSDVTAVDWPPRAERFDVVYCLYSVPRRQRARVKTRVAEGQPVPTACGVWPATNWLEREIYDLFGIRFAGHPDLRRILMPDDWQGHPQRKDYPLEGPGELLLENPQEWLKLREADREADYE
jgi:NADH-quinone oxidoreductase subunit C